LEKKISDIFITLYDITKEISLEFVGEKPVDLKNIKIRSRNLGRLGLEIIGGFSNFEKDKIVITGQSEYCFFQNYSPEELKTSIENMFCLKPPVVISTCGVMPIDSILVAAKKYKVPVLVSENTTSEFTLELASYLDMALAPRITRPAGFLNVHGEGILITGCSGIGKSEAAVELIKRGHRLISDDVTEIRKIGKDTLVGAAPKNIRHLMEIRGIGIINAKKIFGTSAVKVSDTIDLIVNLEKLENSKGYERLGEKLEFAKVLGVRIPYVDIPVSPGRNLAVLIETAAINNRQKKMGLSSECDLSSNFEVFSYNSNCDSPEETKKCIWEF